MIKEELSKTQYKEVEELLDKGIKSIIDELKSLEKEVTSLKASVLMLQVKNGIFATFFGAIGSFVAGVIMLYASKKI